VSVERGEQVAGKSRYRIVSGGKASHGSLSSAPSRNLRNMTSDLQGYAGQCTLGSLTPKLLSQCSLGSPELIREFDSFRDSSLREFRCSLVVENSAVKC
jgi:hypothetical protein